MSLWRPPPLCRLSAESLRRSRRAYRRLRIRLSFCCDRDGCRKRTTPPSVRFLGRKVYLGAIVILISAMRQGPSPRRVRELSARFGVDRADHRSLAGLLARTLSPIIILENRTRPFGSRLSRSSASHTRSWTHSSAVIPTARAGHSCCGSSHRLRSPEAFKTRYRIVLRRSVCSAEYRSSTCFDRFMEDVTVPSLNDVKFAIPDQLR